MRRWIEGIATLAGVALSLRPGHASFGGPEPAPAAPEGAPPPPAPWALRGRGAMLFDLVPLGAARRELPPPLEAVRVAPGFTLGATFLGAYDATPVGPYSEAMRLAALVAGPGGARGFHVPWIVVDSARSQAGGEANWALPKTLGRFDVGYPIPLGEVTERASGSLRLSGEAAPLALPVSATLPFVSVREGRPLVFRASLSAEVSPAALSIAAAAGHPGAPRGLPIGGILLRRLEMRVEAPAATRRP
jgi:hypothetical protein